MFAVVAGLLIGTGTLDDVIGIVLAAVVAVYVVMFIRAQKRIAAAMSDWFGVKVKGLPLMNTKDFDAFCRKQSLRRPDSPTRVEPSREGSGPPLSDAAP